MPRTKTVLLLTAAAICCAAALTGCSDDNTPSSVSSAASKAASAAESLGGAATAAASSLASQASSAFASATAEAGGKLDDIKGGVDVKGDVKLGAVGNDSNGDTAVPVTVTNTADSKKSFAVQVDFTDSTGKRLDTSVVTVSGVAAGKTGKETARSNRTLSGTVKATVARALRY
ncbi:hypothetical protein SAMN04487983_10444 [Streptomyces sp. yr375]|uniref:hypothetical protein n=1 Tax=Streptomyces sp. yr375 TaxID=1761906 RepID=UPI0008B2C4F7|nr:hypothetical protein [Streptomyces sp. yr375]SES34388.1 hypothetical protein SAMN04487983_10444 [Streptomyces sp. yr375]